MTFQRRFPLIASLLSCAALGLSSCAYMADGSNQDIMITTPGAENAKCDIYVDKLRYQALPPQKINILKSPKDMEVTCLAPGNRARSIKVPANFTTRTIWGTPAGMAWDYASQSMFEYPALVAVDFSKEETKPNPLPQHNNSDIDQPESHDLEEYLPGEPKLNSDRNRLPLPLKRKDDVMPEQTTMDEPVNEPVPLQPAVDEKGNLKPVTSATTPATPAVQQPQPVKAESSMPPLAEDDLPALEDIMPPVNPVPPQPAQPAVPTKLYPGQ